MQLRKLLQQTSLSSTSLGRRSLPRKLDPDTKVELPRRINTLWNLFKDTIVCLTQLPFFLVPMLFHLPMYIAAKMTMTLLNSDDVESFARESSTAYFQVDTSQVLIGVISGQKTKSSLASSFVSFRIPSCLLSYGYFSSRLRSGLWWRLDCKAFVFNHQSDFTDAVSFIQSLVVCHLSQSHDRLELQVCQEIARDLAYTYSRVASYWRGRSTDTQNTASEAGSSVVAS